MNIENEIYSMSLSIAIADAESSVQRRSRRVLLMTALTVASRLMEWDTSLAVFAALTVRELVPALLHLRALHQLQRLFNQHVSRV